MAVVKKRPKQQAPPYSIGEFLAAEVAFFMVLVQSNRYTLRVV